jgi:hypothetical protein
MSTVIHWPYSSTNHHFRHLHRLCFTQALFSKLIQNQKFAFENALISSRPHFRGGRSCANSRQDGQTVGVLARVHFRIASFWLQYRLVNLPALESIDSHAQSVGWMVGRQVCGTTSRRRWASTHAPKRAHLRNILFQGRQKRCDEVPSGPNVTHLSVWQGLMFEHRSLFKNGPHPPKCATKQIDR